jgi:glutathione S-transferase
MDRRRPADHRRPLRVGYLYFDHEFGHEIDSYPNIERWRKAIAALPGWRHPYDLMPGHPIPAGALS